MLKPVTDEAGNHSFNIRGERIPLSPVVSPVALSGRVSV